MLPAVLASLLLAQAPAPAKGSPEQRALFEQAQQRQHAFEERLFTDAGFDPLDKVAAEGRVVRRVLFEDPYMMLAVPGIEIERKADGRVFLRVIGRGTRGPDAKLTAAEWQRLAALEPGLFPERTYVPWDPPQPGAAAPTPPPPPPICHAWHARFAATDGGKRRSGSWSACSEKPQDPQRDYAVETARLAVATVPACSFEPKNPFWSFRTCFAPKPAGAGPAPQ